MPAVSMLTILILSVIFQLSLTELSPSVNAQTFPNVGKIAPNGESTPPGWGVFANNDNNKGQGCYVRGVSCGDIQVDVNKTGIAVRVEIPREFLETVEVNVGGEIRENQVFENETYFIDSDIRNDRYYWTLVDESKHWVYDWNRTDSDGPCFKPGFSIFDPNAPWCLEIWNYMNGTFSNFTPPKYVRFHNLHAPTIAGKYNFTLFIANRTNNLGYPDFVHAWNTTLFVPVALAPDPATIKGSICYDPRNGTCPVIVNTKGVAYAINSSTGQKVARAYVDQRFGNFTLTGLAPAPESHAWGYYVTASAGVFRLSTQNVSFSESDPQYPFDPYDKASPQTPFYPGPGDIVGMMGSIHLRPSPVVTGTINYCDALVQSGGCPNTLEFPLTQHPWLTSVGIKVLNITVEAYDDLSSSHIYRYQATSHNANSEDKFNITTGFGRKYVGLDPYGTEFAGLPPPDSKYHILVRVWITGYVQDKDSIIRHDATDRIDVGTILMRSGSLVTGTIYFQNSIDPSSNAFQSPRDASLDPMLGGVARDDLFGGNVIIEARYKDLSDEFRLAGVVVLNRTFSNGNVSYATQNNITFAIIGFSEFYNRTRSSGRLDWQCRWDTFADHFVTDYCRDSGLGDPKMTSIQITISVFIRGYDQIEPDKTWSIPAGQIESVTIRMARGGAINIQVTSYNNRFGTRALQAAQAWSFFNFSIPVRARVYFFNSHMGEIGYVECIMAKGPPCFVGKTSFSVVFAGRNPTLREIWFYDLTPTRLAGDVDGEPYYIIRVHTLGYVKQYEVTTGYPLNRLGSRLMLYALLIGNEVGITAPVYLDNEPTFSSLPENDFVFGEVYSLGGPSDVTGAVLANFTAGNPTLGLPVSGFGGMILRGGLVGQGHFFYVSPRIISDSSLCQQNRCFDYGIDTGTYFPQIPEFGFNTHLTQLSISQTVTFLDLSLRQDAFLNVIFMGAISCQILDQCGVSGKVSNTNIPLSWARIEANSTVSNIDRFVPTLDGLYDGPGALFLPADYTSNAQVQYTVTFSSPFYQPWTTTVTVSWGSVTPIQTVPLNPNNPPARSPPPNPNTSANQANVGSASQSVAFTQALSVVTDQRKIMPAREEASRIIDKTVAGHY